MNMEYTLIIVKPLAINKKIIGKIINRFEENDCYVVQTKILPFKKEYYDFFLNVYGYDYSDCDFDSDIFILVLKGYNLIVKVDIILGCYKDEIKANYNDDYFIHLNDYVINIAKNINESKDLILYFFNNYKSFFENLFFLKMNNEKN